MGAKSTRLRGLGMHNIHKLGAALLAAIAAFGYADAAIGPKITLRVEEPARVGMPVWLFVDIEDACLAVVSQFEL